MQFSSQATLLHRYFHQPNIIGYRIGYRRLRASAALFAAILLVVPFGASAALVQWNIAGTTKAETVCTTIYGPTGPQQYCTGLPSVNIRGMFIADTSLSPVLAYSVIDYNITTDSGSVPFYRAPGYVTFSGNHYTPASSGIIGASQGSPTDPETYFQLSGALTLYFLNPSPSTTSIAFQGFETISSLHTLSRTFYGQLSMVPVPLPAAFVLFTTGLLGIVGVFRRSRSAETKLT